MASADKYRLQWKQIVTSILLVRQRYRTLADYFQQTGATQESLAEQLGVTRAYVSLIASGARQPALKLALRIEALTGVPVESLVAQEHAS